MSDPTFPPGDSDGQEKVLDGRTWVWDGGKWVLMAEKQQNPEFKAITPLRVNDTPSEVVYEFDITSLPKLNPN